MADGALAVSGALSRLALGWLAVSAAGALVLSGLDALPRWLLGETRALVSCANVADAETRLGSRIALPAYFPESVGWPPATIRYAPGPPRGIVVAFDDRVTRRPRMAVLQAEDPSGRFPAALAETDPFYVSAVDLRGLPAEIRRRRSRDGEVWDEVAWVRGGRSYAVRFRGPGEELMRIASSMTGRP